MRVAILGWEFPPFVSGGLGVHCFELSKALAALGVEIDFFMPKTAVPVSVPWMRVIQVDESSFGEFSTKPSKVILSGSYSRPPLAVEGVGGGEFGVGVGGSGSGALVVSGGVVQAYGLDFFQAVEKYNFLVRELVALYHAKNRYDVVHCHDWITAKAGAWLKGSLGLPFVLTVHSTEFDRTADLWPNDGILAIEREAVREADRVITVSNRSRDVLVARLGAGGDKVRVVYNAIDAARFSRRARKEEFGFSEKIVLYHGRLSVQKGIEFFLRAAKKVLDREKNVRFVVSGRGEMLPRLVDLAVELGISGKVSFAGYLPEEKLPALYSISDVFVLPSVSEPFGITALEAMASGAPCIVSKSAGVAEIASHCLKVDFWDVDEMANKMLALLRYPVLKDEMAGNGLGDLRGFSWAACAEKTRGVYGEAVVEAGISGIGERARYARQAVELHAWS